MLFWLVLTTVVLGVVLWTWPVEAPLTLMVVPLMVASLRLGPRELPWFVIFVLAVLSLVIPRQEDVELRVTLGIVVIFAIGLLILLTSFRRSRLGVAGARGESMLVDLRDRIQRQGGIPDLPPGWYAASELR